jgi:hypothetical protein
MKLPGPSEIARRGQLQHVPEGYWDRYATEVAARIRERAQRPPCTCERPGASAGGRCWRCSGYVEAPDAA